MSLYGSLFSGVSGMNAQSSAMGAISDNIANANTVGYKGTNTQFQTLVTRQVSQTKYSPGGVQAAPRMGIDVQGLLQSTNSSTDIAMSGQGFFVVNEVARPAMVGDQFAYTRAGSFNVDAEGYLQNTSGWYLQGWPLMNWDGTTQASTVTVGYNTYMKAYKDPNGEQVYINDNIVSAINLQPLNLNEIGGVAEQTRNIRMGANLPNTARVGETISQPIRIYDSLGGESPMQILWTKNAQNRWKMEAYPPIGTRSLVLRDEVDAGYAAMGRLDLTTLPQPYQPQVGVAGDPNFIAQRGQLVMDFGGQTYVFRTGNTLYDAAGAPLAATGSDGMAVANAGAIFTNDNPPQNISANVDGIFFTRADAVGLKLGDFMTSLSSDINTAFNLRYNSLWTTAAPTAGNILDMTINGESPPVRITLPTPALADQAAVADFLNGNAEFVRSGLRATSNNGRLHIYSDNATTISINAASTGIFAQGGFNIWNADATAGVARTSIVTSGIKYCERMLDTDGAGSSGLVFRQTQHGVAGVDINDIQVKGLESLVQANGRIACLQAQDPTQPNVMSVAALNHTTIAGRGDNLDDAIWFNEDGTPRVINVSKIEVDWANGSQDMTGLNQINLFLGNLNTRDGMTQAGDQYVLNYWRQDGTRFGNFAGVSIGDDGIVTALFDNGVIRPVFQIPVATFINANGLQSMSGNVFLATDYSGDPTLRTATTAGAGKMAASSLEASTVDIATEFTNMIITQRAYSAASKTVVTSDQMLEELINIKR